MPTYEYRCTTCEKTFEVRERISDRTSPEQPPCPVCGGREGVERVYSAFFAKTSRKS